MGPAPAVSGEGREKVSGIAVAVHWEPEAFSAWFRKENQVPDGAANRSVICMHLHMTECTGEVELSSMSDGRRIGCGAG